MEATCASHTGGWDVPRLEWFHGLVNKQWGEEAEPAQGARPTPPPVKAWGRLGVGWLGSVPEWLRADRTCVQGWDWPGQRLEGGPPEPTKGFGTCPGEVGEQPIERQKTWGVWGLGSSCPCSLSTREMGRYPHSHKPPHSTAPAPSAICSSIYITVFFFPKMFAVLFFFLFKYQLSWQIRKLVIWLQIQKERDQSGYGRCTGGDFRQPSNEIQALRGAPWKPPLGEVKVWSSYKQTHP